MKRPRAKGALAAALALCLLLGGCDSTQQLENQAHAVSMGLDYTQNECVMTVQVPTIGGESGQGGKGGESAGTASKYLIYSATADDFPTAYDVLRATLPQELNLTQLKSIFISEAYARSDRFSQTLKELMSVFALSGGAILIITRTEAKKTIENQKSFIGTRLSMTVPAMLDYYAENGYIPKTSLSMLYAGCASVYSTGLAALAGEEATQAPETNAYLPGEIKRDGENKNEYMGSALFNREKMVGVMNGRETQLIHFLSGTHIRMADMRDGCALRLLEKRSPSVKIDMSEGAPAIDITVRLKVSPLMGFPDMDAYANALTREFMAVIQKCQDWGVEPFGFANRAALQFATLEAWNDCQWLDAFTNAKVRVEVRLTGEK